MGNSGHSGVHGDRIHGIHGGGHSIHGTQHQEQPRQWARHQRTSCQDGGRSIHSGRGIRSGRIHGIRSGGHSPDDVHSRSDSTRQHQHRHQQQLRQWARHRRTSCHGGGRGSRNG